MLFCKLTAQSHPKALRLYIFTKRFTMSFTNTKRLKKRFGLQYRMSWFSNLRPFLVSHNDKDVLDILIQDLDKTQMLLCAWKNNVGPE